MVDIKTNNSFIDKEVKKTLDNILKRESFSNGYIFYGPEGIGKHQTAFQFIKDIFKKYSSYSNLDEKIRYNNHPDFLLIEPNSLTKSKISNRSNSELQKQSSKQTIKIDQIRNIKQFLGKKSIDSEKKIILILDAHLLNEAASNCLLKTLEEPTNGIFILLTSRINLLIDTIISRCQLIRFKSLSHKEITTFIKNELNSKNFEIDKEKNFQYLVYTANGSPGKLLENMTTWGEIPKEIKDKLELPSRENLEILEVARFISENLEVYQQIFLINLIQYKWWRRTKNKKIIQKLEVLKKHILNYIQPRLAWEVALLRVANEDL